MNSFFDYNVKVPVWLLSGFTVGCGILGATSGCPQKLLKKRQARGQGTSVRVASGVIHAALGAAAFTLSSAIVDGVFHLAESWLGNDSVIDEPAPAIELPTLDVPLFPRASVPPAESDYFQ